MRTPFFLILLFSFLTLSPVALRAEAIFTEIMYDPQGADGDAGGEWVEVQVTGSDALNFATLRIADKTGTSGSFSNRTITHVIGPEEVEPGAYGIIAKNPDQFRATFPLFAGSLYSSPLSLTDEDTLHLLDAALGLLDDVSWTSDQGGKGDGNTLQKVGDEWTDGTPTPDGPFAGGTKQSDSGDTPSDTDTGGDSSHHGPAVLTSTPPFRPLVVHIGDDRLTAVGNPLSFEPVLENESPSGRPEFSWSMGDGTVIRKRSVEYEYARAGTYVVVLTVSSGNQKAVARITVRVIKPELHFVREEEGIAVSNLSSDEVNLYGWEVESGSKDFVFLGDTILLSGSSLILDPDTTGIEDISGTVDLLNPAGERYARLEPLAPFGEVAGVSSSLPAPFLPPSPTVKRPEPPPVAPLKKPLSSEGDVPESALEPVSIVVEKPQGVWEKMKQFLIQLL